MGFSATWLYDEEYVLNLPQVISNTVTLLHNELPIASTIFSDKWTLATTQRLITNNKGVLQTMKIEDVVARDYGLFKGNGPSQIIEGSVSDKYGTKMDFLIETGHASMVMINALKTLLMIRA